MLAVGNFIENVYTETPIPPDDPKLHAYLNLLMPKMSKLFHFELNYTKIFNAKLVDNENITYGVNLTLSPYFKIVGNICNNINNINNLFVDTKGNPIQKLDQYDCDLYFDVNEDRLNQLVMGSCIHSIGSHKLELIAFKDGKVVSNRPLKKSRKNFKRLLRPKH